MSGRMRARPMDVRRSSGGKLMLWLVREDQLGDCTHFRYFVSSKMPNLE